MPKSTVTDVGARRRDGNRCPVHAAAGPARDVDRSSRAASPLSEDDNRTAGEQIRDCPRLHIVGVESVERHVDAGEDGRVDVASEPRRRFRRLAGLCHDERLPEPRASDALDEESIHAAADTKGEDIDIVSLGAHVVEHVRFRLDVAVGHQDDAARRLPLTRDRDRPLKRGQQPRPATTLLLPDELERTYEIGTRRRHRTWRERGGAVGKHDDVERVGGSKHVCEVAHQFLRRVQREAVHRSRHVEDEDVLARRHFVGLDHPRRFRHEQEEVFAPALIQQKARGNLLTGQSVAKDEVPIARQSVGLGERDLRASRAARADVHLVRG